MHMLQRAATLNGRAAAWFRRFTRGPVTLPPAHRGRQHPQAQLVSAPTPLPHLHLCGARGHSCYRRMARRIPVARPDGYSTSDGEAEELDAWEDGEITEPVGAGAEGDDSEEFEVEGFMLDLSTLGSDNGDKEGTEEEGGK